MTSRIANSEEDTHGVATGGGDLLVVGVAARESLGEDGRIRGDADKGVLLNGPRELAGLDQIARQIINPDALPERRELMQAGAHRDLPSSKFRSKDGNDITF